jgi:ApaG domain
MHTLLSSKCRIRVRLRTDDVLQPIVEYFRTPTLIFCCITVAPLLLHAQFRIDNHGEHTVRLRSRHLQFCSAADNRLLIEVPKWGPGVVGETPILLSGEAFEYCSYCDLPVKRALIQVLW